MKQIPLTQGKVAVVDDEDFDRLSQFKWYAAKTKAKYSDRWYAVRGVRLPQGPRQIFMHCEILGLKGVDHKDNDGLNNQRTNLRPATQNQQNQNRRKYPNCTSSFKGVRWRSDRNKWEAQITLADGQDYLGLFDSEESAAMAYSMVAEQNFGEFANLTTL
jgi:AP2 domain